MKAAHFCSSLLMVSTQIGCSYWLVCVVVGECLGSLAVVFLHFLPGEVFLCFLPGEVFFWFWLMFVDFNVFDVLMSKGSNESKENFCDKRSKVVITSN